jgi:ribonucleoside-triphosphate reductase
MTQIIASVASSQYGGQSVNIKHLGKYLYNTKQKYLKKYKETCPELGDEEIQKLVDIRVKDELAS